jgi:NADH-quinone oxidoreductase subunit C
MKLSALIKQLSTLKIEFLRVAAYEHEGQHLEIFLKPGQLLTVAKFLKEQQFILEDLTAIDLTPRMQAVYHFAALKHGWRITLRIWIDRETPAVPSLSKLIPGANWHERETKEFFGITFLGHPYLSPLLLPDESSHPLLKKAGEIKAGPEIWPVRFCNEVIDERT